MAGSRSFKEYVSQRFDNDIFNSTASYVEDVGRENFDSLNLRLYRIHRVGEFELADAKVLHVDAYDLPGTQIGFDIRVEAQIEVREGDHHYDEVEWAQQWFVLRCTGDLEKDLNDFAINEIEIYNSKDSYERKLYDSLVPVINKPDYEVAAEGFLRRNYRKALVEVGYVDPMEVAKSMGLNVIIRSITEDGSIFGQVYFKDCDTELYDDDKKKMVSVSVPAKTILVDPKTYFLYNLDLLYDYQDKNGRQSARAILDMKNKTSQPFHNDDIYQMAFYGQMLSCKKIILCYPRSEERSNTALRFNDERFFLHKLYGAYMNLAGNTAKEFKRNIVSFVYRIECLL